MSKKTKTAANEINKNMEYLIAQLHKEWERSGQSKAEAVVTLEEAGPIYQRFALLINGNRHMLEEEEMTFVQSIKLTKESYIFLRILKKMKTAEEKANQEGMDIEFSFDLDQEECHIFRRLILSKER